MVAAPLLHHFPSLNPEQRRIVQTTEGPVLIIAGPGSGKTFSLVLRTLNVLALGKAKPSEVVVCTFTEKAAHELRDRIHSAAAKIGYAEDLSELRVGTIHGICYDILNRHRHHTPLGNSFQILDGLTQQLFLFEQFDLVFGPPVNHLFLGKWSTKWTAIEGAISFFNKITEEQIDPARLVASTDPFLAALGGAYSRYRQAQYDQNRIDFAVIQSLAFDVLQAPASGPKVCASVRYLMVDEYQDTNFIQEQLLLKIASAHGNIKTLLGDAPGPTAPVGDSTEEYAPGAGRQGGTHSSGGAAKSGSGTSTHSAPGAGGGGGSSGGHSGTGGHAGPSHANPESYRPAFHTYVAASPDDVPADPEGLDHAARMQIEQAAITFIRTQEPALQTTPPGNPGFDLFEGPDLAQATRFVEVKSRSGAWSGPVALSREQFLKAHAEGDRFWLYVVENTRDPSAIKVHRIQNPAGLARHFCFDPGWRALSVPASI